MTVIGIFGTHVVSEYRCGLCESSPKPAFKTAEDKAEHLRLVHRAEVLKMTDGSFRYLATKA